MLRALTAALDELASSSPGGHPTREMPGADSDYRLALNEELGRLPDKYRAPLVLCYLEGRTNAEAAAVLHCSLRTTERLLARAAKCSRPDWPGAGWP